MTLGIVALGIGCSAMGCLLGGWLSRPFVEMRMKRCEARILDWMKQQDGAHTGHDIGRCAYVPTSYLYAALFSLERSGAITSEWKDGDAYPRRRMYTFTKQMDQK